MAKNETATVTKTEQSKVEQFQKVGMEQLLKDHKTVSGVIRYLDSQGLTKGEIAKVTEKRYQHVRNVLITPLTSKTNTVPAAAANNK